MIQRVHIENFKAIYRPVSLSLQPFTVFIGNNGTGKSSILEALKLLQNAVNADLTKAFNDWGGLDKIRNYNAFLDQENITESGFRKLYSPVSIYFEVVVEEKQYEYLVRFNMSRNNDYYVVEHEELLLNGSPVYIADVIGKTGENLAFFTNPANQSTPLEFKYEANRLVLGLAGLPMLPVDFLHFQQYVKSWQFLSLNAHDMGKPVLSSRMVNIKLGSEGRNIAEYLLWLRGQGQEYLDSIIRKMKFVLPYLNDLQPHEQETFNREIEVLMYEDKEGSPALPGWLLSSGTLRILALLAMFETPEPPSVLFIDEVENGLDPRTIGLLISEIQNVVEDRTMQVIVTTHSPYFLDLVPIQSLIVAEKANEGSYFHIPENEESLNIWKEKFSPGKLYTMGKLTR
ncbi:DUF2813 domain-containing protein [Ilyomonas limi]|uniref:DUF2813 domain-containing protein n=1 Tax=Ilyomonas limi TaxID=2575867 RepID=A0A4U3L935_9BACT|nr:AAA family ATPase [Ilyomonas limi]TKK70217.1 DUF2813 domain-containing protein [Ilyomonas limi]